MGKCPKRLGYWNSKNKICFWNEIEYGEFEFEKIIFSRIEKNIVPYNGPKWYIFFACLLLDLHTAVRNIYAGASGRLLRFRLPGFRVPIPA